jgi:hypothetical protein
LVPVGGEGSRESHWEVTVMLKVNKKGLEEGKAVMSKAFQSTNDKLKCQVNHRRKEKRRGVQEGSFVPLDKSH